MLSDTNIKRELGRNLLIYPLKSENIKGASINLTASRFAWSLATKKEIVSGDRIIIPPHDTGLIETEETVAISGRLAGTYHSRVKTVSAGTGHIGTTMNPYWIGHSLIAVHNDTDRDVEIAVGDPFVTLVLYYLDRKAKQPEDNPSGRGDVLQDFFVSNEAKDWIYEQPYNTDWRALKKKMEGESEYSELTKQEFKRKFISIAVMLLAVALLVWAMMICPPESVWSRVLSVGFSGFIIISFMEIYTLLRK